MASHAVATLQRQLITLFEDVKRAQASWDEINSHAFPVANSLTNSIIQSKYVDEPQYWHPQLTLTLPNIIQAFDRKMQKIIKQQHTKLNDLVEKLAKQYIKMKRYNQDLHTIYDRAQAMHGADFVSSQPIFQTCPLITFVDRIDAIVNMYAKELETKRSLLHTEDKGFLQILSREEGVVLLSIWINQPSILQSVLQEWQDMCAIEMSLTT
ncbi:hypothetical protein A0J61_07272 [Choanephora cucurbitarum]|uniref:Uncharacterized protein n=1 Tax=Choanephora cucurbitarum TaxID=101091 RepID=A0A1C7N6K1_9FUNG|nr:hypothetical protein A0J61_07272 [Choanephora cucurbitarum]